MFTWDRLRQFVQIHAQAEVSAMRGAGRMTTTKAKDGGPAFPCERAEPRQNPDMQGAELVPISYSGMSLRDWYAGHIYAAMLATKGFEAASGHIDWAMLAYHHADAMLQARGETKG